MVDLLIGLVHKINTRVDRRVERDLTEDVRRRRGKEGILFRLAQAAVERPDELVCEALFLVVGEKTLREFRLPDQKRTSRCSRRWLCQRRAGATVTRPRHIAPPPNRPEGRGDPDRRRVFRTRLRRAELLIS